MPTKRSVLRVSSDGDGQPLPWGLSTNTISALPYVINCVKVLGTLLRVSSVTALHSRNTQQESVSREGGPHDSIVCQAFLHDSSPAVM
jgi:hypothetical protein